MPKTYLCTNQACPLGSKADQGRFTGGISKEQAVMLTGDPEAGHGVGVCPNCGQSGKEEK
jgi:hypothetical protein